MLTVKIVGTLWLIAHTVLGFLAFREMKDVTKRLWMNTLILWEILSIEGLILYLLWVGR